MWQWRHCTRLLPACIPQVPSMYCAVQVTVNEEVDLEMVVQRLSRENEALRAELAALKAGGSIAGVQQQSQQPACMNGGEMERRVFFFLENESPDARLEVPGDAVQAGVCGTAVLEGCIAWRLVLKFRS